jgi:glycine/D-amino acid oxidase-like deaminating enzyme
MTDTAPIESPVARLPESADVVVIGGGIVGTASAYYLAARGHSVVLVEKGRLAGEQSGRNWGWVRQQARDPDELPLMIESNRIWQGLEKELGADIEWTRRGNLAVTRDPARMRFFEEWLLVAREAGLHSKLLSESEIRSLLPQLAGEWLGAMYTPSDGHAEPAKATRAFGAAALSRGAVIAEGCAADRIQVEGNRVVGIETERGRIRTDHVVCAAGVWAARFLRPIGIDLPIRIVRSTVAATRPIAPLTPIAVGHHPVVSFRQRPDGTIYLAAGGWSDYDITLEALRHVRYFMPNYVKNRRLIRLHLGRPLAADIVRLLTPWSADRRPWRRERVLSPAPSQEKVRSSLAEFARMFPSVSLEVARSWAGYTDTTPDALPVIDALAEPAGLILATGLSGHGFGMGPIVGRLVSELIVDGTPALDLRAFRFSRFADGTFKKPRLVT